jgi:hypothetical protein
MTPRHKTFTGLNVVQQRLLLGLAAVVLIPFLALTGFHLRDALLIARLGGAAEQREDAWKAEAKALDDRVDPETLKDPINRNAYQLAMAHDELAPDRRVIVTIQVPIGMKKTGADRPKNTDDLADEAAARTQDMARQECTLLIGSLASRCTPMEATGRRVSDDIFEYQLQLAFTEIHRFGKQSKTGRYAFVLTRSSPGAEFTRQRFYFEKSERQRQRIYESAADTCQSIRQSSGNCSITALSVSSRLDRGTPMVRLSASAAYASLIPSTELTASLH